MNPYINIHKMNKNIKNVMMLSIILFAVKRNSCIMLNIRHKVITKRYGKTFSPCKNQFLLKCK